MQLPFPSQTAPGTIDQLALAMNYVDVPLVHYICAFWNSPPGSVITLIYDINDAFKGRVLTLPKLVLDMFEILVLFVLSR